MEGLTDSGALAVWLLEWGHLIPNGNLKGLYVPIIPGGKSNARVAVSR